MILTWISIKNNKIINIDFEYNNGWSAGCYIVYDIYNKKWAFSYWACNIELLKKQLIILQKKLDNWVNLKDYMSKFKMYNRIEFTKWL